MAHQVTLSCQLTLICKCTFSKKTTLPFLFCRPSINGQLLGERICSLKSKFVPVGVDPIPKGPPCPNKKQFLKTVAICNKQIW